MSRVSLTEHSARNLIVRITQDTSTCITRKAPRMELLLLLLLRAQLDILPFDTAIAGFAKRIVEFVVVLLAVRMVGVDVEIGAWERG